MKNAFVDMIDVLLLRITSERIRRFGWWHLFLGVAVTWLVGVGRWYDDPMADPVRLTGVGSIVYVLFLGTFIYLVARPLASADSPLRNAGKVIIAVMLTAAPAALYAFPIERFGDPDLHLNYNTAALFVVSTWRVMMFYSILRQGGEMDKKQTWAVMLVVISVILGVLGFFGVLGAVANSMGGFRDAAEERGATLAGYAFLAAIPMFIVGVAMYGNQVRWKMFRSPEIPFWTDVDDDEEQEGC